MATTCTFRPSTSLNPKAPRGYIDIDSDTFRLTAPLWRGAEGRPDNLGEWRPTGVSGSVRVELRHEQCSPSDMGIMLPDLLDAVLKAIESPGLVVPLAR